MTKKTNGSRHLDILDDQRRVARFQKNHGSPTYTCRICSKKTRNTGLGENSVEMCASCFKRETLRNEHGDYGHKTAIVGCPDCGN